FRENNDALRSIPKRSINSADIAALTADAGNPILFRSSHVQPFIPTSQTTNAHPRTYISTQIGKYFHKIRNYRHKLQNIAI
ncbi:MAG TPA: hypothetical protein VL461_14230, partial [Dictyobacter sp.]|nr:hypothetical protein [Dictyobacter sp.]